MRTRLTPAHRWATAIRAAYWAALTAQGLLVLLGVIGLVQLEHSWALKVAGLGAIAGLVIGLIPVLAGGYSRRTPLLLGGFMLTGAAMLGLCAAVLAAEMTAGTVVAAFTACLATALTYLLLRLACVLTATTTGEGVGA